MALQLDKKAFNHAVKQFVGVIVDGVRRSLAKPQSRAVRRKRRLTCPAPRCRNHFAPRFGGLCTSHREGKFKKLAHWVK